VARILIIDDEAPIRAMLTALLVQHGYEVVVATQGREGIREHRKHPADLIITDMVMPEMDGIEILTELRRNANKVPIIAISGNPSSDLFLHMAKVLGAHRTFAKPLKGQQLLESVQMALAQKA
jgi:DNA-binding response OmpR family regulator